MTSARPAGHSPRPHMQGPISQTQDLAIGHSGAQCPVSSVTSSPPEPSGSRVWGRAWLFFFYYRGKIHIT